MKLLKKTLAVLLSSGMAFSAFAFNWADELQNAGGEKFDEFIAPVNEGLNHFAGELAIAVPQAATQQNVWADAYIGKLLPSVPPHFGGGLNVGFTHLDTSGLAKAAEALNIDGIKDNYYFPVFTADLRVGGVFLPFDLGISVMKTGTLNTGGLFGGSDLSVDFLTLGLDLRYAIFEGGLVMPKLSVGAGYFYNQGTFGADSSYADASIGYKVHTLYASVQLSKQILFVTPFIGVRGLVFKYENSWEWEIKDENAVIAINALNRSAKQSGSVVSDNFDFAGIQPQLFAGCGFNFLFLQATLSVTCDLRNIAESNLWSGAFSLRAAL